MITNLRFLGSGGWFPAHGRETACALLLIGDSAVMIDAGTGVGRLVEQPELLAGVAHLDIILTHFHLDHITGLAYLPATGLCAQTTVWGPGRALYGTPTRDLLAPTLAEPFHPIGLEAQDISVRDLPVGELELAGIRIETRRQARHSAPTLGLRFADLLTWVTDTAFDPDSAGFARGCRVLAHEAWYVSEDPRSPAIHSSAAQAAEVAAGAGVEQLLLIHVPPFTKSVAPLADEAVAGFASAMCARDGLDVSWLLTAG
jgi:ribonuclease BN (tRNA processing enzyme)